MSKVPDWQWYAAGVAVLLVTCVTLHLIELLGTATLLWLMSVIVALSFAGVLFGRRIALAAIVGGFAAFWASILWAIPTPRYVLGGAHRMMFAVFVLTPAAAAASGYLAFRLTKEGRR